MAWKFTEDGSQVVMQEGNPVWVYEDGREAPFNAQSALKKLADANAESKDRKEKIRELSERYKPFEEAGIEDVAGYLKKANEAIQTVENLNDKKLVEAGEVEKLKKSVSDAYEDKIRGLTEASTKKVKELEEAVEKKDQAIRNLLIRGAFDRSTFLKDKTVLIPEIAYATFGRHFQVEEEGESFTVYAVDTKGEKIFSLKNPGKYADPDEAIEAIIMSHPQKDALLKATASGSGAHGGGGGTPKSKLEELEAKHAEAMKNKQMAAAIALKNEIYRLKNSGA